METKTINLWSPERGRRVNGGIMKMVSVGPLTVEQAHTLAKKLNREAWEAVVRARKETDVRDEAWWFGRVAGLLDAIMMLDGSYDLVEELEKEVGA